MMRIHLKMAMLVTGIKQYKLAQMANMDPTVMSRITSGIITPTEAEQEAIRKALDNRDSNLFSIVPTGKPTGNPKSKDRRYL